ncbi:Carnitine O-acetyltransferase mitochondrial, partial [Gamsiella multidivaricata]
MPPHTQPRGSVPVSNPTFMPNSCQSTPSSCALSVNNDVGVMDKGQDQLPSLPVPPLDQTLTRYLESIRPLTSDDEYNRMADAVQQFNQSGQGPSLDQRLRKHAKECEARGTSWLAEWWDDWAYFSHRDSSTFFVNYYFGFQDDPRMPTQTARAALLVSLALEFRQLIS